MSRKAARIIFTETQQDILRQFTISKNIGLRINQRARVTLRARFFDSKTGRFIGRDPLHYIDGMSLYRGYFAKEGTDPAGKHKNCVWFKYYLPLWGCVCKNADRAWKLHDGKGHLAHCVAHCLITVKCGNFLRLSSCNVVGLAASELSGMVLEIFGPDKKNAPGDLVANKKDIACGLILGATPLKFIDLWSKCITCCGVITPPEKNK